jgi:hypothetical protein
MRPRLYIASQPVPIDGTKTSSDYSKSDTNKSLMIFSPAHDGSPTLIAQVEWLFRRKDNRAAENATI